MRRMPWSAACGAAILAAAVSAAATARATDDDGTGMGGPPAAAAPAPGEDVLVLKDGTEIRGRITAEDDAGYAVKVGGSLRVVEKTAVSEVKRGSPAPAPGAEDLAGAGKPGDAPAGDPSTKKGKERRKEKKRGEGDAPPADGMPAPSTPAPLSEAARDWARSCIERLQGADPAIQRSAAEALRALGAPVLPVLREAHAAADDAGKQRLARIAGMIELAQAPGSDGAPGGKPGQPGGKQRQPEGKQGQPGARQGQPGAPGRGAGILDRVKTDLGLDEAESRTVGGALLTLGRETRETIEDARDGLITYEDAKTRVSGLRGKLREDLKTTLTEEQLVKLDGILDEMGRGMGKGGGPKKDPPSPPQPEPAKPEPAKPAEAR